MSYDLDVYARRPVHRADFQRAMRARGWEIRFLKSHPECTPLGEGPIQAEDVIGWPLASPHSGALHHLVDTGDREGLESLWQTNAAQDPWGSFGLSAQPLSPSDIPMRTPLPWQRRQSLIAERLAGVRIAYGLCTSGGRSARSLQLQEAAWRTLGELAGGILCDPQEEGYSLPEDATERRLQGGWRDLPGGLRWVIGWFLFTALAAVYVRLFATVSPDLRGVLPFVPLTLLPLAYGLYRGISLAWRAAQWLTLLFGCLGLVFCVNDGFTASRVIPMLLWFSLAYHLHRSDVEEHFGE